jgi:hypothetical protein
MDVRCAGRGTGRGLAFATTRVSVSVVANGNVPRDKDRFNICRSIERRRTTGAALGSSQTGGHATRILLVALRSTIPYTVALTAIEA